MDLTQLIKKRGLIKSSLTRFANYLNKFEGENDNNIAPLKTRLHDAEKLKEKFEEVQTQIEITDNDTDHESETIQFEDAYYDAIARASNILHELTTTITSNVGSQNNSLLSTNNNTKSNVKLPTINLPEFDGKYENWVKFKETFQALIDGNDNISDIQKFHYLISSLKDKALQTVQALPISHENYKIAFELLTERFENKRLSVFAHVNSILNIATLGKENGSALRNLLDTYLKNKRALMALNEPVESWGTILICLISAKLDQSTRKLWEEESTGTTVPTIQNFEKFLKNRCQVLENISGNATGSSSGNNKPDNNKFQRKTFTNLAQTKNKKFTCNYCKQSHLIYYCKEFKDLSVKQRIQKAKELKLCLNCLKIGHEIDTCSGLKCMKCKEKHNTLLHLQNENNSGENTSSTNKQEKVSNDQTNKIEIANHSATTSTSCVMLSTACVKIVNSKNELVKARALLDNGSTANYMTEGFAKNLNLNTFKINPITVHGMNGHTSTVIKGINVAIKSNDNRFETNVEFLITRGITEKLPIISFDKNRLNIPSDIVLADNEFNTENEIDILLGVQIFYELLLPGRQKLDNFWLQETVLGYVFAGAIDLPNLKYNKQKCYLATHNNVNERLCERVEQFWKIEEVPEIKLQTAEEKSCELNFTKNTTRDSSGRFIVKYPINPNCTNLGKNFDIAMKRFLSLERKLQHNESLKAKYTEFLNEYKTLGHMNKVANVNKPSDSFTDVENTYVIPHHDVHKEGSTTSSLRVVFDASCKTSSGHSLNDILLNGPCVQSDLFSILLRFRKYQIILSADIEKMFRQISVHEEQRNLQTILWRESPKEPISLYKLRTITYGLKPATYLATRCVNEIAIKNKEIFPKAAHAIINDTYIDDFTSGVNSLKDALKLKNEVDNILSQAGFKLRKWRSNSKQFMEECKSLITNQKHFIKDTEEVKTLGLCWDAEHDILSFAVNISLDDKDKITKRLILSITSQIFDPLGLVAPIVIYAKCFLQSLWLTKLNWDDEISDNLKNKWRELKLQILKLNNLKIPRQVLCADPLEIELHGFADASEKAYGCAIYIKGKSKLGVNINLLCAKSRVAPIKQLTLPKLELCAALLLAKLIKNISDSFEVEFQHTYCWTDSNIVLSWLRGYPTDWKTFVANRVAKIQHLTQGFTWSHVSSKNNPADIVSRGMHTEELSNSIWWHGPSYLQLESDQWPCNDDKNIRNVQIPEKKNVKMTLTNVTIEFDIFSKFSSLKKLVRVVSYCLRFKYNALNKNNKEVGKPSSEELDRALLKLIKLAQSREFYKEINSIQGNKALSKCSKILPLNPFLDQNNVLRVGGRISKGSFDYKKKYPVLLPKSHLLTKLIIKYEHLKNLHAGAQQILAGIREEYWPISGLNTVKSVLRECVVCFKFKPRKINLKMGDLPSERITPCSPFSATNLDFAGPFTIKETKIRNKRFIKVYLCIFVCSATKAIHIEVASDLTKEVFLNTLKRFVSRRGLPSLLYSDNATNFVSADKELQEIRKIILENCKSNIIKEYCVENKINWKFMPAKSPHFGGLHEAAVKSVKNHLKKTIHNTQLTYENLQTLTCQIEAILNSRPLFPMSNDINDLTVLTPGHFLIGRRLNALPQHNMDNVTIGRLNSYQHLQYLVQGFWQRWCKEYLCQLQTRNKWVTGDNEEVKVGALVILKENSPPQCWPLGRILEVHPGQDGIARVVTVKTKNAIVKRALRNVSILPIEEPSIGGSMFDSQKLEDGGDCAVDDAWSKE